MSFGKIFDRRSEAQKNSSRSTLDAVKSIQSVSPHCEKSTQNVLYVAQPTIANMRNANGCENSAKRK